MDGSLKLIDIVKNLIIQDAIVWSCKPKDKKLNRCVLVLDREGVQILSATCKVHDVFDEGVILVEDLFKVREPINMDVIYFIAPTLNSITAVINDFPKRGVTKYKAAHIFFTQACPDSLFNMLSNSLNLPKIKSCKEINIAFIPSESQVYFLNCHDSFQSLYNPLLKNVRTFHLEELATRISTVCYALKEYPSVRYIKNNNDTSNFELANLVLEKLKIMKDLNPKMGEGHGKLRSQLIIVDRTFDLTSIILHELTFQAMAYDNLTREKNLLKFTEDNAQKPAYFEERDLLWTQIRHQHIYHAISVVSEKLKNCVSSLRASSLAVAAAAKKSSVSSMSHTIKIIPELNKEKEKCSHYMSVLQKCMDVYGNDLEQICVFEQNLVMGERKFGADFYNDSINVLKSFLTDDNVSTQNKMRLIMLFILCKGGLPENVFNEFIQIAQLSPTNIQTIMNLNIMLGSCTTNKEGTKIQLPFGRRTHVSDETLQVSGWTPLIKNLMENCIENKLDPEQFPFVGVNKSSTENYAASSSRYTAPNAMWHKPKVSTEFQGSRVIIYMLGGVTYSEMRCAYEVSKKFNNWEIVIGSSNPLTPYDFIQNLSELDKPH